jgi:hypothetical protein
VIAIDAVRPEVVAEFWCEVLGWGVVAADGDIVSIGPGDASWPAIDIVAVPEGKVVKNRRSWRIQSRDSGANQRTCPPRSAPAGHGMILIGRRVVIEDATCRVVLAAPDP